MIPTCCRLKKDGTCCFVGGAANAACSSTDQEARALKPLMASYLSLPVACSLRLSFVNSRGRMGTQGSERGGGGGRGGPQRQAGDLVQKMKLWTSGAQPYFGRGRGVWAGRCCMFVVGRELLTVRESLVRSVISSLEEGPVAWGVCTFTRLIRCCIQGISASPSRYFSRKTM